MCLDCSSFLAGIVVYLEEFKVMLLDFLLVGLLTCCGTRFSANLIYCTIGTKSV